MGLDKHVMEGGRESNGPQKLNRASRQKTSAHHPLMVRLQDFSINGLEESGHSPLREACSSRGRGLKKSFVPLGKEGGGGDLAKKRERQR